MSGLRQHGSQPNANVIMAVDDVSVDLVNIDQVNRSTGAMARGSAGPTCQPHTASLTSRAHAVWQLGSRTRSGLIMAQGERAGLTARELSSAWRTGPAGHGGPSSCSLLLLCFFFFSFISLTAPVPLVGLLLPSLTRWSHMSKVVESAAARAI